MPAHEFCRSARTAASVLSLLALAACAGTREAYPQASFVDDATITARIRSRLAGDASIDASGVSVETEHGTVVLSGSTQSTLARNNAVNIAMATRGARLVRNEISIRP